MSLQFDEHRLYLADEARMAAFRRAIDATVRPGDVVVDLGCGTGILGLMAVRAGAARVYAIDDGGMIDVARQVAATNGVSDRIVHLPGASMRLVLPERVDIVIADQMGRLGFEAGVVEYFADAVHRFLKPAGRLVPQSVTTWIAPLEAPDLTADVDFWQSRPGGFDMSVVRAGAVNTGYPARVRASQQLAAGQSVLTCVFADADIGGRRGQASFVLTRPGRFSGLIGWFVATLADGVTMTNAPGAPDQIGRRQAFLPFAHPIDVVAGDVVEVALLARPVEVVLAWDVTVRRGAEILAHARQSTLAGMLIPREVLSRTDPARRPRLTPWAEARATVLRLCDGAHTLAQIEQYTASAHPALFHTPGAAAEFVAEVVTRYGRDDAR